LFYEIAAPLVIGFAWLFWANFEDFFLKFFEKKKEKIRRENP